MSNTTTVTEFYPDLYDKHASSSDQNKRRERLYIAVLYLLRRYFSFDSQDNWLKVKEPAQSGEEANVSLVVRPSGLGTATKVTRAEKIQVFAVYGRMLANNMDDPGLGRAADASNGVNELFLNDTTDSAAIGRVRVVPRFIEHFTVAVQRYNANRALYEKVFGYLLEVGATPTTLSLDGTSSSAEAGVFTTQLSQVVDRLIDERVSDAHPQLRVYIANAVGQAVGSSTSATANGRLSAINIDLPNLDAEVSVEIQPDNIRALSVLYFAAQLEDMRFFSVADQVAQQFQMGMLPLTRGPGGDAVYQYIKGATQRLTEVERRSLYARSFGFTQGGVDESLPNLEFSNLWIRGLSATSSHARQSMSQSQMPAALGAGAGQHLINLNVGMQGNRMHHMQVYKTMRDLAVNLSLHGYAMAHYAAIELQEQVRQVSSMLSHPDVLAAFGVRDYFQLIERVARDYMGSEVNSVRQRVQAQAGSRIIQWLGAKSAVLASPNPPGAGVFLDAELVNNVEKWLAVTGTTGSTIERYSEPVPVASQPTIPGMSGLSGLSSQVGNAMAGLEAALPTVPEA